MNFSDFIYERPSVEGTQKKVEGLMRDFNQAKTVNEANEVTGEIFAFICHLFSMMTLVDIRHNQNVSDEYYLQEKAFMDHFKPYFDGAVIAFYQGLLASPFKEAFEDNWGSQIMTLAKMTSKTFNASVFTLLGEENKWVSRYQQLIAKGTIDFAGESYNLKQMGVFMQSSDRSVRKRAHEAVSAFYADNEARFDDIYDNLVRIRHEIAKGLGEENFVQVAYNRLNRSDYYPEMVKAFREEIKASIVPMAVALRQEQKVLLGLDSLNYYDESTRFKDGAPKPLVAVEDYYKTAKNVFKALGDDTHAFMTTMTEKGLMDLPTRASKSGGGYCTFIPNHSVPFIFMNANGTSSDIETLFHEAGHGYQMYKSRHFSVPQYFGATVELGEIHSMAMELLVWPHMEEIFGDQTSKYKRNHLTSSLQSLPYMALVDAFQHEVYGKPTMTAEERKGVWRTLEKEYLPSKDYEDNDFLKKGTFWYRQSHIFANPFYYIDYALAQVSAFEIWQKANENREEALSLYNKLCSLGGSVSYFEALEESGLSNPFDEGCVGKIIESVEKWLGENSQ